MKPTTRFLRAAIAFFALVALAAVVTAAGAARATEEYIPLESPVTDMPRPDHDVIIPHYLPGTTEGPCGPGVYECGVGVGGDQNRSQWDEEEYRKARDKRKKELEKREKELEKDIAERRKKHLDSKDGKKTKKKLEDIEKERKKKQLDLFKEKQKREGKMGANCCGYGEAIKIADWYLTEQEEINEEAEKKKEQAVEDDMRKNDPKGSKKYKDARNERDKVKGELLEIRQTEARERQQQRSRGR